MCGGLIDFAQQTKDFSVRHEATIHVRATSAVEIPQIVHQNTDNQWIPI